MTDNEQRYKPPGVPVEAGRLGYNEHGIPLHACNGYRLDEHYWCWLQGRTKMIEQAAVEARKNP